MLFTCTIENADILIGVFDEDQMIFDAKLATSLDKSVDEYALLISSIFSMHQVALSSIDGAIVASVVRPLNSTIHQAIEKLMHVKPMTVSPGLKTGLNIKTDIPSQVGADIVANAVAAVSLAKFPLVLIDFGTATTLTCISEKGDLCGVLICPGVQTSLNALTAQAAELPGIELGNPGSVLAKNTNDSMNCGFVYGSAAMIDGLLDRISLMWDNMDISVLSTGDLAQKIIPYCQSRYNIQYQPNLALSGLKIIYSLNERRKLKTSD